MSLRNIKLAYVLTFARHAWFWLGIWVFYYLKFTSYAGIGIIETVMILTLTLFEIPTGAIADLFGKKNTLIISFLLQFLGLFLMGVTLHFLFLTIGVFVSSVGLAFYSGTLDALVFDSLKENGKEEQFMKTASRMKAISWVTPAICSAIGGFLYAINPRLPFYASAWFYLFGFFVCLFLIEPKIDTIKFSFVNFLSQTKQGFKQLFLTPEIKKQTIILLSIGVIIVILDEMLNSFLAVEFGFQEQVIGIFWAFVYVAAAFAAQTTSVFKDIIGNNKSLVLIGGVIVLTLIISPVLGIILGGATILIRSCSQSVYDVFAVSLINQSTKSEIRATTLSTFNMIKNVPYVLTAFLFGSLTDIFSAKTIAFFLGLILLGFLSVQVVIARRSLKM